MMTKPTRPITNTFTNGSASSQEPVVKMTTPSQVRKLSDMDRARLLEFLEKSDKPFSVATVPFSRKRKRTGTPLQIQADLFEDRLSVQYEVKPAKHWESLRPYKKFTIGGGESIAIGECILVKHDADDSPNIDVDRQWKAKVLEVRALDSEHVYVRVAWLNRPEDLSGPRKHYYGRRELIPTNQMDIIDAMTVNGKLEVVHWDDHDDESKLPDEDEFFWRQTLDVANTGTFSGLRSICIDEKPANPDEMILQCPNAACRKWMHLKCIAVDAATRAADGLPSPKRPGGKRTRTTDSMVLEATSPASTKAQKDSFTALVFVKDYPKAPDAVSAETTKIVISNSEDGQLERDEEVRCLFCKTTID